MHNGIRKLAFITALLGPASLVQPALADKALYEAAKKEGQVTWYTTLIVKQAVRPIVAAFQKKYPGIKVRYSRANSSGTAIKILSEGKAGRVQGDIFDGTTVAEPLKDAKLVEKWMPAGAKNYPNDYKDPDGYWAATHLYFLTPGVNTSIVKLADAPKKFEDLLDPKWKGKMGWAGTSSTSGAAGFIGNVLITMGEKRGMEYLRKFAKQNIISIGASARKVLDQSVAGEFPIALQIFNHHTVISARKGAPVTWIKMEPVTAVISAIGLIKGAPHPNAGKLLIEYILSEDGQKVLQKANYLPALPSVPAKVPELKPQEGKFKVNVMSQKMVHQELEKWKKIHKDLFR
jgi:ABC-type Fe3+ transport system substrate-binding protein